MNGEKRNMENNTKQSLITSDRIIIGSMDNTVFTFRIDQEMYDLTVGGNTKTHRYFSFVIKMTPRIDGDFSQEISVANIQASEVSSIAIAIQELAIKLKEYEKSI